MGPGGVYNPKLDSPSTSIYMQTCVYSNAHVLLIIISMPGYVILDFARGARRWARYILRAHVNIDIRALLEIKRSRLRSHAEAQKPADIDVASRGLRDLLSPKLVSHAANYSKYPCKPKALQLPPKPVVHQPEFEASLHEYTMHQSRSSTTSTSIYDATQEHRPWETAEASRCAGVLDPLPSPHPKLKL